jgi:transglutaminase-like putative cysteine protease
MKYLTVVALLFSDIFLNSGWEKKMRHVLFSCIALLIFSAPTFAEEETPDLFTRYEHYYANFYVNEDGSSVESRDWAMTVLKEGAVAGVKQTSITYSTSIEKAEVIEAYTRKADGRRIDSPKSNFQVEVNSGKSKDAPVFSDLTTLTVVFPDVTVGDTVVFSYKVTRTEPMFPKHFSAMEIFLKEYPYDDVRIRIDAPSSLWAQYEARGLTEKISEKSGRRVIDWAFQNKQPNKNKRINYSVYDVEKEPGYAFSTFKSYSEIAEAYGVRARPKATVTERIKKLADEVAKDKKTPREQARALYDWVATNISYAGNCIGVGAVVPHDLAFVLDNRMGDCKDHATLLQALLMAKSIQSTQALVNAGSIYRLPKIPVISTVNHVINYIPSLDLYADSTSTMIPFGMLPFSIADKPVLLVDGFKEGARTPTLPVGTNQQHMKTVVKISSDGSITGSIEVTLKGIFAASARAQLRHMSKDQEEDLVKNVFKSNGYIGSGKFDKEDPKELLDTYKYKVIFEMKEFIQRPGAGAFSIYPLFSSEAPVYGFLRAAVEPEETVDVACSSGASVEEYTYQFPKNMKILSIPENMTTSNAFLSYKATYRLKGDTLAVKRTFDDKTHGNICSPETSAAYKVFAAKVLPNAKMQVLYK